jgi:hypothetical protein
MGLQTYAGWHQNEYGSTPNKKPGPVTTSKVVHALIVPGKVFTCPYVALQ